MKEQGDLSLLLKQEYQRHWHDYSKVLELPRSIFTDSVKHNVYSITRNYSYCIK